jgi:hypothetical protein
MNKALTLLMFFVFANCGRAAVIAQYDFEGNTDDSIRGAGGAGLVTGTASYTDVSSGNKAFHFDGSTYIKAASVLGGYSTATVSSWVKFDSFGSPWDVSTIVKDDWNAGGPIHFGTDDKKLSISTASGPYPSGYNGVTGTQTLSTGQWYHFAFTFNGTSSNPFLKLYINGDEVGSQVNVAGAFNISPSGVMAFGAKLDPSGYPIDPSQQNLRGDMDGLVFFNAALSGSEIKSISNAGVGAVPEPSTISMLAIGLVGFALNRRRRS